MSVLFADIAGFTSFCSNRHPTVVLTLLETLYGELDKNMSKRGVFKVEHIGDCLMAACGLPDVREDHAVVMCQFAVDLLKVSQRVFTSLVPKLGKDVLALKMRVGVHSGKLSSRREGKEKSADL